RQIDQTFCLSFVPTAPSVSPGTAPAEAFSRRTILFRPPRRTAWTVLAIAASAAIAGYTYAQQQPEPRGKTSYLPVDLAEPFASITAPMVAAMPKAGWCFRISRLTS